jgi:hypothetical protein
VPRGKVCLIGGDGVDKAPHFLAGGIVLGQVVTIGREVVEPQSAKALAQAGAQQVALVIVEGDARLRGDELSKQGELPICDLDVTRRCHGTGFHLLHTASPRLKLSALLPAAALR